MTVVSSADLTLLRTRPHRTKLHLSIYVPRVILAAQVNNANAAKGDVLITFDNVTAGSFANVLSGMTVWVGSTSGGRDLGRARIGATAATSTTISVSKTSHIVWADDSFITVVNFWEPFPVYPRITLDANNIPTFYKDYDIANDNQNDLLFPVLLMGPNLAAILPVGGGPVSLYFNAAGSYDLNDSPSFSALHWEFEGGSPSSFNGSTPGYVNYGVAGHYRVTLRATIGNGPTVTSAYRFVSIYDNYGGVNPPVTDWGIENLSGDYRNGGWEGEFWMRQDARYQEVVDGALVVMFADDWYGATKQSIGGNYVNRESIVFVGYVREGSIEIDAEESMVSRFKVSSITQKLQATEGFSVFLESSANSDTATVWVSAKAYTIGQWIRPTTINGFAYRARNDGISGSTEPTWPTAVGSSVVDGNITWDVGRAWFYLTEMTADRAVHHYLRWHTTIYDLADVRAISNSLPVQFADFPQEPMYSSVDGFLQSALFA